MSELTLLQERLESVLEALERICRTDIPELIQTVRKMLQDLARGMG